MEYILLPLSPVCLSDHPGDLAGDVGPLCERLDLGRPRLDFSLRDEGFCEVVEDKGRVFKSIGELNRCVELLGVDEDVIGQAAVGYLSNSTAEVISEEVVGVLLVLDEVTHSFELGMLLELVELSARFG